MLISNNATVSLVNTILAYNQENNCSSFSPPTSLGHNLADDATCGLTQSGDQEGEDPLLGPLADNGGFVQTHALRPGSPAIDAGDDGQCPTTDARGVARPHDGDGDGLAVCDIGAVEARNQLSIADSTVSEGNSGTVTAAFTVTLAPTSTVTVSVTYATVDETATGGVDYTPVSGTLVFNPGETEKQIPVPVIGDLDDESDETFGVQLSAPVNADLLDAEATGTIIDDDGLSTISIADQTALEGDTGTTEMQFEVTLSPVSASVVTVDYATANGSALAGSDYTAVAGTLTFNPGETTKAVTVTVLGDNVDEGSSETFAVQLSNPTNATLADGEAVGTITDDDTARLRVGAGPQVLEGDAGTTPATFDVTLLTPAAFTVTVDYATFDGSAVAGEDYLAVSGTLTLAPLQTTKPVTVLICGDTISETDETFWLKLSNPNPVSIDVNSSMATILNDDGFKVFLPLVLR